LAQSAYWGDKKYVLPSLLADFAGKINLIYIDPPFDSGADFSFTATVPENQDTDSNSVSFTKEPSIIEQKAYRDTWGRGLDSYLQWFYDAVVLLHELLHETGSIYVHLAININAPLGVNRIGFNCPRLTSRSSEYTEMSRKCAALRLLSSARIWFVWKSTSRGIDNDPFAAASPKRLTLA
jgi:hypothetical protein